MTRWNNLLLQPEILLFTAPHQIFIGFNLVSTGSYDLLKKNNMIKTQMAFFLKKTIYFTCNTLDHE